MCLRGVQRVGWLTMLSKLCDGDEAFVRCRVCAMTLSMCLRLICILSRVFVSGAKCSMLELTIVSRHAISWWRMLAVLRQRPVVRVSEINSTNLCSK